MDGWGDEIKVEAELCTIQIIVSQIVVVLWRQPKTIKFIKTAPMEQLLQWQTAISPYLLLLHLVIVVHNWVLIDLSDLADSHRIIECFGSEETLKII